MTRLIVLILIFSMAGCTNRVSSESGSRKPDTSSGRQNSDIQSRPGKLTKAQALYIQNCADCHGWEGKDEGPGAKILGISPPSLRRKALFSEYSEEDLIDRVMFGKVLTGPLHQIENPKTTAELNAILRHMRRLQNLNWDELSIGEQIYDEYCLGCHGLYGRGDGEWASRFPIPPEDLSAPRFQNQLNDEQLLKIIADGKGEMPGTGDVLRPEQIQAVVSYVRVLSPGYEAYERYCTTCHGSNGFPSPFVLYDDWNSESHWIEMPTFDAAYFDSKSEAEIRKKIKHMLAQNRMNMPHFSGELEEKEVRQILNYLRTLPPAP